MDRKQPVEHVELGVAIVRGMSSIASDHEESSPVPGDCGGGNEEVRLWSASKVPDTGGAFNWPGTVSGDSLGVGLQHARHIWWGWKAQRSSPNV